jgi:hypothetical protein
MSHPATNSLPGLWSENRELSAPRAPFVVAPEPVTLLGRGAPGNAHILAVVGERWTTGEAVARVLEDEGFTNMAGIGARLRSLAEDGALETRISTIKHTDKDVRVYRRAPTGPANTDTARRAA